MPYLAEGLKRLVSRERHRGTGPQYRQFFDAYPLPIYVHDLHSLRFLDVNAAAIAQYGYTREEFLSMTICDIRPPEDVPRLIEDLRVANSEPAYAGRWHHRKKNGSIITVDVYRISLSASERVIFAHDVTESVQNEAVAREASRRLDLALKASRTGVWTWYPDGDRVVWDAYSFEIFGTSRDRFGGTRDDVLRLIHPEDRSRVLGWVATATPSNADFVHVFRVIWPQDGSIHHIEQHGHVFFGDDGKVIRVSGVCTDVTKALEAEAALRKSEAGLSLALSLGNIVTWEQDLGTLQVTWSAEMCRLFGVDPADARPSEELFLASVHSEDRERVAANLEAATSAIKKFDCEYRIIRPDGSIRTIHGLAQAVLDSSAKPLRIIGTMQDITDQHTIAEQLRQAQKMEAIGTLAGGIAHDFNNLLGVISGYCDLLLKKTTEEDPARKSLVQIEKAADRAASLTRQLLAFSRRQIIQPKIIDLNELVLGVHAMLERTIGEDIELNVVCCPKLWNVSVDACQMEQVLMNLAVNARDAMPHGGRITVETANFQWHGGQVEHVEVPSGPYVLLAVTDNGCGLTSEVKAHLFEPFFTTKEFGRGTGLGLSTVYGIVKQSNGFIWVYSEIGFGTTFKIYLPAVIDEKTIMADEDLRTEPLPEVNGAVLVVEDQELFRDVMCEVLTQSGFRVLVAQDGPQALDLFRCSRDIDIVLSDVVMPKMSGPQLAEKLTALNPKLKILFMSGYAEDAVLRHGILPQRTEILQKPFTPDSLVDKVRRMLLTT